MGIRFSSRNKRSPHDSGTTPGPGSSGSAVDLDENEEIVITGIRATGLALGLRRTPIGFYTVVQYSGLEWRTENKRSSVNNNIVEWDGSIPVPFDLSAVVRFEIYAFFEFQPTLGNREQLRELTITVEQLLDHSAKDLPFKFFPKDKNRSPCSSLLVTVSRRKQESSNPSSSRVLDPHSSIRECRDRLKNATDEVHRALSRHQDQGGKRDLECSIQQFEHALNICSPDHPCRAAAKSNMALAKVILYRVTNAGVSLDVALSLYYRAVSARPVGHPDRPSTLIHLAILHFARFEKRHHEVDAAQAEALLHHATELSSADSHESWAASTTLQLHAKRRATAVQPRAESAMQQDSASPFTHADQMTWSVQSLQRYEQFGDLDDLQRAISLLEGLVKSIPFWDPRCPGVLQNFGHALSERFRRLGELGDLEQAISREGDAVYLTPDGHPDKHARLNNLGDSFRNRFERLGELSDLQRAISMLGDSVDLTPDGHPNKPDRLSNLGISFLTRFNYLGRLHDLERAISRFKDAIDLVPDGHPHKSGWLNNLGNSLVTRFNRLGELGDLDRAISALGDAVALIPDGHPHKPALLNNLGTSLVTRFQRLGELSDLERAISTLGDAVNATPDGHPVKPTRLNNLGNCFRVRFERFGELSDLERTISGFRDILALTPDGHPHKPGWLGNLGNSFLIRFKRLGEPGDLERAISKQGDAVNLTPDGHPCKPTLLTNLGSSLRNRFEHFGELRDLEQAISRLEGAVSMTPDGHPDKPGWLNNLYRSLVTRFEHRGDLSDLERAISGQRDAVDLIPDGHPHKPTLLQNLGSSFVTRFKRFGELSDLEQAISKFKDAVDLTPDGHPHKPHKLTCLGHCFFTRFKHLGELSDLEQAISVCSHYASHSSGPATDRFNASLLWIECARLSGHHSLLRAYSIAVGLLPQLAWIGLSLPHRFQELMRGVDVVRDAAAAALESGHPETAVEWLEQGRSIVWGELVQLRSPYDELSAAHPDYARKLRQLSAELEHAGATRETFISKPEDHRATESLEQVAHRHRTLAIERDQLLQEIRALSDFERFLLHKEYTQLRASAHSGPVVILNAAESRCDALIVHTNADTVIHVPLPNFPLAQAKTLQTLMKGLVRDAHAGEREGKCLWHELDNQWESTLSSLWKCVVKPVLDSLALAPGKQSRIFWCPTGPLTFFPIHAAGFFDAEHSQPGHKVFDFVVSSYVPTLMVLTPSPDTHAASSGNLCFLAVRQPQSDGLFQLPGVNAELRHIREIVSSRTTLQESSSGTVEEVLDLMKKADWVHFACHGIQDATNPTASGLCLANERRLKLSDIVALSRPRGGLAFLSACHTARGDKQLSDEAIHIAAGMLFAGYGGVVGTMWSISDRLAPEVAKDVYEQLFSNRTRPDYREAARALQNAVGRLRDSGASFLEWIPFIHVGL